PTQPIPPKMLSFTDNRQDASLQAGHFNDFIEVGVLRSALYRAVVQAGAEGLAAPQAGSFTSRFFIKPPPEAHEPWPWCSSFWEPRAWLATVPARSDPPSIHHLESASRRW